MGILLLLIYVTLFSDPFICYPSVFTWYSNALASPLEEHLELRVQIAMLVHFTAGILWLIHKMHVVVWNLQCSMAKRTPWVEEMPVILL